MVISTEVYKFTCPKAWQIFHNFLYGGKKQTGRTTEKNTEKCSPHAGEINGNQLCKKK